MMLPCHVFSFKEISKFLKNGFFILFFIYRACVLFYLSKTDYSHKTKDQNGIITKINIKKVI